MKTYNLLNGDIIVELDQVWKEDNGIECKAKCAILLSSICALHEYPEVLNIDWKTEGPKTWIDDYLLQQSYLCLVSYEELFKFWSMHKKPEVFKSN